MTDLPAPRAETASHASACPTPCACRPIVSELFCVPINDVLQPAPKTGAVKIQTEHSTGGVPVFVRCIDSCNHTDYQCAMPEKPLKPQALSELANVASLEPHTLARWPPVFHASPVPPTPGAASPVFTQPGFHARPASPTPGATSPVFTQGRPTYPGRNKPGFHATGFSRKAGTAQKNPDRFVKNSRPTTTRILPRRSAQPGFHARPAHLPRAPQARF
jgi:hypothetical protein